MPGDVLDLTSYRGVMGCDVVLLGGSCIVNECMLTGEWVWWLGVGGVGGGGIWVGGVGVGWVWMGGFGLDGGWMSG